MTERMRWALPLLVVAAGFVGIWLGATLFASLSG
jgi:hypothetical protein